MFDFRGVQRDVDDEVKRVVTMARSVLHSIQFVRDQEELLQHLKRFEAWKPYIEDGFCYWYSCHRMNFKGVAFFECDKSSSRSVFFMGEKQYNWVMVGSFPVLRSHIDNKLRAGFMNGMTEKPSAHAKTFVNTALKLENVVAF